MQWRIQWPNSAINSKYHRSGNFRCANTFVICANHENKKKTGYETKHSKPFHSPSMTDSLGVKHSKLISLTITDWFSRLVITACVAVCLILNNNFFVVNAKEGEYMTTSTSVSTPQQQISSYQVWYKLITVLPAFQPHVKFSLTINWFFWSGFPCNFVVLFQLYSCYYWYNDV